MLLILCCYLCEFIMCLIIQFFLLYFILYQCCCEVIYSDLINRSKRPYRRNKALTTADSRIPKLKRDTPTNFSLTDFQESKNCLHDEVPNLKISAWNIGGFRSAFKRDLLGYVLHENPDILCLQDIRTTNKILPAAATINGYHRYVLSNGSARCLGVALYTKTKPLDVRFGFVEGKYEKFGNVITAEYETFYVLSVNSIPAGEGLTSLVQRMYWDVDFRKYVIELDKKKPLIMGGSFYVAHLLRDIAKPEKFIRTAGFTIEERSAFRTLLKCGFADTFRRLYLNTSHMYTFWGYMGNCRVRNIGKRLDYFLVSERLMPNVCDHKIRTYVYGSRHCPITLFLHT